MRIERPDKQQPIQIVQITDTHLGEQPGDTLVGLDTDRSLEHVIALATNERPAIELVLATGDLSNHGAEPSYRRFQRMSQSLAEHVVWLSGNHDDNALMQEVVGDGEELSRQVFIGNWQIIMLDSSIAGEVGGGLAVSELNFLRQCLQTTNCHTLVCLHHQPVPVGCGWLDQQQVANADAFFEVLDSFDHVRGVLWGHVHQQLDRWRDDVRLMATPSTCVQFAPNSADFKLDTLNPGYRWLELNANGDISTAVSRVEGVDFKVEYDSQGY